MKNILLIAALLFYAGLGFSQKKVTKQSYKPMINKQGIVVSVAKGTYIDTKNDISHKKYFLQYNNTTNKKLVLQFTRELHYGDNCIGCDQNSKENRFKITLLPHETISYDKKHNDKRFTIFIKDNQGWIKEKLTGFSLTNITITEI